MWRWGREYSSWSSILLLAKLMSATGEGMADCWEAKSVTGLKNDGVWTGLCDNTFQIKCGLAPCPVSDLGLHELVCICKAILEPSRRTQRRMGLIRGRDKSVVHRLGRDTILHVMGLALNSKHNSDQQLLSSADCRQTRHALDYSIGSLGHRRVLVVAIFFPAILHLLGYEVWLTG